MKDRLTHIDQTGKATMVDISGKAATQRSATACGSIHMRPETVAAIGDNRLKKGDVLATARIAGIMAAKRTHDLIPLCHPLALTDVQIDVNEVERGFQVCSTVRTVGKTGVEMEALTACMASLLTLYDMAKAIDRHMVVSDVQVVAKSGGASGDWSVGDGDAAA
ncbi:MAG: cyclic pyranopterin monophosphate synthase MoaC [Pseudomonadota bacterium]